MCKKKTRKNGTKKEAGRKASGEEVTSRAHAKAEHAKKRNKVCSVGYTHRSEPTAFFFRVSTLQNVPGDLRYFQYPTETSIR